MSTIKVNSVQPYTGTNVDVTGSLSVSGVISGDGSGLTNVPGGGGTNLIPLNNTWTGTNNFNNSVSLNQGATVPYDNGVKQLYVGLSGSKHAIVSGFDYEGKAYGSFSTNGSGGFNLQDNFEGTGSQIYIRSDNGNINISGKTNVGINSDSSSINIETKAASTVAMRQKNKTLTLGNTGLSISNTPGGAGVDFSAGVNSSYGLNLYDSAKDVGWTLDVNTVTGTGNTNSGLYANYGAFYADLISFQDSSNYTDGAITVHQILNTEDINVTGSLSVSGDVVCNNPTLFKSRVTADIITGGTTGAVPIDFSLGNFFTITPSDTTTISPSNVDSVKSQTISIVIDNTAAQAVTFSGILWVGGTPPTISPGGKDIVTLVSFGSTVYGTAVLNLS